MKFHKRHIMSYHVELPFDSDYSLTNTAATIRSFVDGTTKQIEKDGLKCDEYDIMYFPSLGLIDDDKLIMWLNVHDNGCGLLIVQLPVELVSYYKPETISEVIENALKED